MVYVPTTYHILSSSCHFYASSYYIRMFIHQDTMKKITFIIICVLATAAAYAQAPKDSTVNIIAYWNAGEKYAYEYSAEEYKIVNGDTTEVSYSNSIQIYEILEETGTSYGEPRPVEGASTT